MRLSREKFCNTLHRFWSRFSRSWDVLLHGNPAADIFTGLKVSSGGELGFGVGEEEWGSGERDVLEDLTRRTEGLVDVVVSRFGEPKPSDRDPSTAMGIEALPWMGSGREPGASDGIIFGGTGAIERHSLRDISLWMRQIYTNGHYAYGIRDNPQRERRKRRRHNPPTQGQTTNEAVDMPRHAPSTTKQANLPEEVQVDNTAKQNGLHDQADLDLPKDGRPEIHPRVVSHDHATTPQLIPAPQLNTPTANVPPPMVSAVEQALNKATDQAEQDAAQEEQEAQGMAGDETSATTLGIPDQYMKYLTFGLSTLAKPAPKKRPPSARSASTAAGARNSDAKAEPSTRAADPDEDDEGPSMMTHMQPMPDGEALLSKLATQKRLENDGYFVVGLEGDPSGMTSDNEADATDGSFGNDTDSSRIVLRTIQVKTMSQTDAEDAELARRPSLARQHSSSSAASRGFRRLRIIVYAHRPFIYCFLFEPNTPSLQYTSFYRTLRQDLIPIHKPLLSSTSAAKVAQRIENSQSEPSQSEPETASVTSQSSKNLSPSKNGVTAPIFDLIYDPRLLTVHTSIPNIPEPGTPAAEGILSTSKAEPAVPGWTRIDAMNVHSQILNTLSSVLKRRTEFERTSKTTRGWWVVWMKVPPSSPSKDTDDIPTAAADERNTPPTAPSPRSQPEPSAAAVSTPAAARPVPSEDLSRIAFLVRRATDAPMTGTSSSSRFVSASSNIFSNMTFGLAGSGRSEEEITGGANASWGPQALSGGMGVDARRYVEGLLSLGR